MRSHFEQAFDGLDSDDAEMRLRSRRILDAERLTQDAFGPAMEAKPVKFSKRMASLPLPKSKRRLRREGKIEMRQVPLAKIIDIVRSDRMSGFMRSMMKGEESNQRMAEYAACTNTIERLLTPAPSIPRVSLEMPSQVGVTILTEAPLKICR